jgi:hypothetical protein
MSATPAYPLLRPANTTDPRFSLGLALDVAEVLTRHGYPPLNAGTDLIRLQQALHSASSTRTTVPATDRLTSHPR